VISNLFSRLPSGVDPLAIDHEEFEQAFKTGDCVVVDVREPHEFASAHIPEPLNLPLSIFDPTQLPSDKPVVLICHSGMRSKNALSRMQETGRDDVRHYAGGIVGWRSRGGVLSR
jgi:rhodanese-related sulfurtransferase